jgi:hypothetical protein
MDDLTCTPCILLHPPCPRCHSPPSPSPPSKNNCLETSHPTRPTRTAQNIIVPISFAKFSTGRQATHRLVLLCGMVLPFLPSLSSLAFHSLLCLLCLLRQAKVANPRCRRGLSRDSGFMSCYSPRSLIGTVSPFYIPFTRPHPL